MRPFRSLRVKFVLYFVGFMSASLILLARSLFQQEHDALAHELRKRLTIQVANLQAQAREALETNDDLTLLTNLRALRNMDDFVFAAVLHPDGTVFAHSDVRLLGRILAVPDDVASVQVPQVFRESRGEDGLQHVEVWAPVVSTLRGDPERIGLVCLGVSKAPLLAAVDDAEFAAVRVGAFFTLLAIVGTLLIARTVTQPIGRLVHGVQRIASGDLAHKVNLRRSDEIGLLSDSFDRMTEDLQNAQQELLKQRLYEKELEVAGKIQASLLPAGAPDVEGFEVSALSVPARVVGGDFYDYVQLRGSRTAFLVADVAGKGVSAGLVMAAARSAARSAFGFTASPYEALVALNEQLLNDFDRTTFVTMLCMVLEPTTKTLHLANAGHPPLLWWRSAERRLEIVRSQGVALGILPRALRPAPRSRADPARRRRSRVRLQRRGQRNPRSRGIPVRRRALAAVRGRERGAPAASLPRHPAWGARALLAGIRTVRRHHRARRPGHSRGVRALRTGGGSGARR